MKSTLLFPLLVSIAFAFPIQGVDDVRLQRRAVVPVTAVIFGKPATWMMTVPDAPGAAAPGPTPAPAAPAAPPAANPFGGSPDSTTYITHTVTTTIKRNKRDMMYAAPTA